MQETILIYRLGSLGDTIAALPCFHLIERAFPDARRLVLTNVPVSTKAAPLADILQPGGLVHGALAYPVGSRSARTLIQTAQEIRASGARTLVYLAANRGAAKLYRDLTFFRLAGLTRVIGAPLTKDLRQNRVDPSSGELEYETARLGRSLHELGEVDLADRSLWDLRLTPSEQERAAGTLAQFSGSPFFAINMGGKAAEKDWGEANWASLLSRLSERLPEYGLLVVGALDDSERAERLGAGWRGTTVNACGTLTPRESAAALQRAALFIGHDSGPLHLAGAVSTPCVGLFGDYNKPRIWHPFGSHVWVIHELRGLQAIQPDCVVAVVASMLQNKA